MNEPPLSEIMERLKAETHTRKTPLPLDNATCREALWVCMKQLPVMLRNVALTHLGSSVPRKLKVAFDLNPQF
jgi:hypothetical protein